MKVNLPHRDGSHHPARIAKACDADQWRWSQTWVPKMWSPDAPYFLFDDSNWPWDRYILQGIENPNTYRTVCLSTVDDHQLQGLLHLNLKGIRDSTRSPVLYVEHIATAPWNRSRGRIYRLVGTVLVCAAIAVSEERGYNGRLGLVSLPAAEGFYERIGFRAAQPADECEDARFLQWFELDEETASGLMSDLRTNNYLLNTNAL